MSRKIVLLILDGLGLRSQTYGNAVTAATMPGLFQTMAHHSLAELEASGEAVGLAADQAGNSEVGHATIGAGRTLMSKLAEIDHAYKSGQWNAHPFWRTLRQQQSVHIVGVLSDAGVHAHLSAMIQTIRLAVDHKISAIYLHVFLDGVDAPVGSAPGLLAMLQQAIAPYPQVRLGVVMGRHWATDRSGDLTVSRHCVDALYGKMPLPTFSLQALECHINEHGNERNFPAHLGGKAAFLTAGASVILTNHRADRTRQLAEVLLESQPVYCLADLSELPKAQVFFPQARLDGGLIDQVVASGLPVEVVAEACKFSHVTYFLNGFKHNSAVRGTVIPTIDDQAIRLEPAMSIHALEQSIYQALLRQPALLCINIPNLDQVGHTGDLSLTEQAAGHVDACFQRVLASALEQGFSVAVTADHGNADVMLNDQAIPQVSHSVNPVPFFIVSPTGTLQVYLQPRGALSNIAPTLLKLMDLKVPSWMHPDLLTAESGVN